MTGLSAYGRILLLLVWSTLAATPALADVFKVRGVETRLEGDTLVMDAQVDYRRSSSTKPPLAFGK